MGAPDSQLLIVEGNDERHVIEKLLARYKLTKSFAIDAKGGFPELHKSIYNEVNAPRRQVLGILADANDHPDQRWESISDKLKEAACEVPPSPVQGGTVFDGPRDIRVGVWLMPDNDRSGELEDFVAELIPQDDPIWPQAQSYINNIPVSERPFPSQKLTRAHVHAWLATREKPRPMGLALTAGDLLHDAPLAHAFVGWIRSLFSF